MSKQSEATGKQANVRQWLVVFGVGVVLAVGIYFVWLRTPPWSSAPPGAPPAETATRAAVPTAEPPLPAYAPADTSMRRWELRSSARRPVPPVIRRSISRICIPPIVALSDVDPAREPPDGGFEHPASGRSYRIYRADGKLRHQEVMRNEEGKEIARLDLPVRYVVGSGKYSLTYLVEFDGLLYESPLTWYESEKKWHMSPGYDARNHFGFDRPVNGICLECHAGRFEVAPGTENQVRFFEKVIGCESCHGPGELHRDLHLAKKHKQGDEDQTIVHPGKLPRDLQESLCAHCHESVAASALVRGRKQGEFRPGRPLRDYRVHYGLLGGSANMTVVGHVKQLRRSACYQKSSTLTCLTCHDPHPGAGQGYRSAVPAKLPQVP